MRDDSVEGSEPQGATGRWALDRRGIAQPPGAAPSGPWRARSAPSDAPTRAGTTAASLLLFSPPQTHPSARPVLSQESKYLLYQSTPPVLPVPVPVSSSPFDLTRFPFRPVALVLRGPARPVLPDSRDRSSLPPFPSGYLIVSFCIPSSVPYFSTFFRSFLSNLFGPPLAPVILLFFRDPLFSARAFFLCCFRLSLCSLLNLARPVHSQFFDPFFVRHLSSSPPRLLVPLRKGSQFRGPGKQNWFSRFCFPRLLGAEIGSDSLGLRAVEVRRFPSQLSQITFH